jgi:hypothetical protein
MKQKNRVLHWLSLFGGLVVVNLWIIVATVVMAVYFESLWPLVSGALMLATLMADFQSRPRAVGLDGPPRGPLRRRLYAASAVLRGDAVMHGVVVTGSSIMLLRGPGRRRMVITDTRVGSTAADAEMLP